MHILSFTLFSLLIGLGAKILLNICLRSSLADSSNAEGFTVKKLFFNPINKPTTFKTNVIFNGE